MNEVINKAELDKLLKNLGKVEVKLQKRILTGAIKAGAKTVQDEAKAYVPYDSGDLKDSIKVKKMTNKEKRLQGIDKTDTAYMVGIDYKVAYYANIVEFGSKNMSADPFMTPAYELTGRQVIEDAKQYIKKRLNKVVK